MKRKKTITIRTHLGISLFFILSSITFVSLALLLESSKQAIFSVLFVSLLFIIISILFLCFKIKLYLDQIDNGILIIDSERSKYDLNINCTGYVIFCDFIILKDENHTVYLEKNKKLICELKKLGILEKELI